MSRVTRLDAAKRRARFYASANWDEMRSNAVRRDGGRCTFIDEDGKRCREASRLHVHHIRPIEEGGAPYDLENLRTLCETHHRKVEAEHRQTGLTVHLRGLTPLEEMAFFSEAYTYGLSIHQLAEHFVRQGIKHRIEQFEQHERVQRGEM